jgi:hypothetical protein
MLASLVTAKYRVRISSAGLSGVDSRSLCGAIVLEEWADIFWRGTEIPGSQKVVRPANGWSEMKLEIESRRKYGQPETKKGHDVVAPRL